MNMKRLLPTIEEIKTAGAIFYDCDGVLTNNHVLVSEDGKESAFFSRSDGLAISEFRKIGIHQAIISTEINPIVAYRAEKLQIPVIYRLDSLSFDKGTVLKRYAAENRIDLGVSIFIGNDINDLPALKLVGYPAAPNDAEEEIISFLHNRIENCVSRTRQEKCNNSNIMGGWISTTSGGCGVVRELYRELIRNN